jgi:hypothetical protein
MRSRRRLFSTSEVARIKNSHVGQYLSAVALLRHRPARPRIRFCLNSAIFVLYGRPSAAHARGEGRSAAALTHGAALTQNPKLFTVIEFASSITTCSQTK